MRLETKGAIDGQIPFPVAVAFDAGRVFAVFLAAAGTDAFGTVKTFMLGTTPNSADAPTIVTAASNYPTTGSQRLLQLTNNQTTADATALGLTVASGCIPPSR